MWPHPQFPALGYSEFASNIWIHPQNPSEPTLLCNGLFLNIDNSLCSLEVFHEGGVLRHLPDVLPLLVEGKSHDVEDTVQLIMVVGIARLDVLLPAVEDRLRGQKFGKNASDKKCIVAK